MLSKNKLIREFETILQVSFKPDEALFRDLYPLLKHLADQEPIDKSRREYLLLGYVNSKFRFNADGIRGFLASAARVKVTFNYHEKLQISDAFDTSDNNVLKHVLYKKEIFRKNSQLMVDINKNFKPIAGDETISRLHSELREPTLTRKDSKPRDWSKEILSSLFGAFVYRSYPAKTIHSFTDPLSGSQSYCRNFWDHLHQNWPDLFNRDNTLSIATIDQELFERIGNYTGLRDMVFAFISQCHEKLTNHGYLAILLKGLRKDHRDYTWELFSDVTLFAEKHIKTRLDKNFHRKNSIKNSTRSYIADLDIKKADFSILQQGFYYKDCFVLGENETQSLLMLFQKNVADETLIPCPACRSHTVQGNSYSSLGVRSWECNNQICPDRSKFNRGKRYSFLQLLKQQAILKSANDIPRESVRKWARDVQPSWKQSHILDMLVRHYTLTDDTIFLSNFPIENNSILGRTIRHDDDFPTHQISDNIEGYEFFNTPYFSRYVAHRSPSKNPPPFESGKFDGVTAICGDTYDVLQEHSASTIDGAVTSPPYYNAREYSQWENIYTYLYDMYNINTEVFRVLKPGSIYLYNIFDYFDNERNISLSAMGERRMILGAYTVDLFRRVGFNCIGNIVWDKGDIEGKRGFNAGNFSPYYQSPFNCWEHVLIFEKPNTGDAGKWTFPRVFRQKPVIKMVRGKNVHGHTAPFPDAIPQLLIEKLEKGSIILDPFAGSMTTGIVAGRYGIKALIIEKNPTYFKLGCEKLRQQAAQLQLI